MVKGDEVAPDTEPEFPEQFRSYSENEKHWQARRAFILRNSPLEGGEAPTPQCMDQLLSLSMVWANHLFLGCRDYVIVKEAASFIFAGLSAASPVSYQDSYNKDLLEKVTEMADGIEVEDVPHFTTRDELIKRINTSA